MKLFNTLAFLLLSASSTAVFARVGTKSVGAKSKTPKQRKLTDAVDCADEYAEATGGNALVDYIDWLEDTSQDMMSSSGVEEEIQSLTTEDVENRARRRHRRRALLKARKAHLEASKLDEETLKVLVEMHHSRRRLFQLPDWVRGATNWVLDLFGKDGEEVNAEGLAEEVVEDLMNMGEDFALLLACAADFEDETGEDFVDALLSSPPDECSCDEDVASCISTYEDATGGDAVLDFMDFMEDATQDVANDVGIEEAIEEGASSRRRRSLLHKASKLEMKGASSHRHHSLLLKARKLQMKSSKKKLDQKALDALREMHHSRRRLFQLPDWIKPAVDWCVNLFGKDGEGVEGAASDVGQDLLDMGEDFALLLLCATDFEDETGGDFVEAAIGCEQCASSDDDSSGDDSSGDDSSGDDSSGDDSSGDDSAGDDESGTVDIFACAEAYTDATGGDPIEDYLAFVNGASEDMAEQTGVEENLETRRRALLAARKARLAGEELDEETKRVLKEVFQNRRRLFQLPDWVRGATNWVLDLFGRDGEGKDLGPWRDGEGKSDPPSLEEIFEAMRNSGRDGEGEDEVALVAAANVVEDLLEMGEPFTELLVCAEEYEDAGGDFIGDLLMEAEDCHCDDA